jgi:hypothetical protein
VRGDSSHLFSNHVNSVLDATIRNDWENGRIDDSEVLDAVYFELAIDDTVFNALRQTKSSTRICIN